MPVAQYLCDSCEKVLEKISSEKYPANMTYAPPNTTSHFFQCTNTSCNAKFIAYEEESGKLNWDLKDEENFKNILKSVNERQERTVLKDEKEKLSQEKAQVERMLNENPQKISVLKQDMENIKIQVNKLTDEYEERSVQSTNLEEALKKGRLRLEEIEKRLRELIHIK
jgi:chromosome segregation ATPase